MPETTPMQLDSRAHDAPMSIAAAISYLKGRGVGLSRASLYRWNADQIAAGHTPLLHQPSGDRGRIYVVPAEIEGWIRSRCSDNTPDRAVS
jgi:hypothetical protein